MKKWYCKKCKYIAILYNKSCQQDEKVKTSNTKYTILHLNDETIIYNKNCRQYNATIPNPFLLDRTYNGKDFYEFEFLLREVYPSKPHWANFVGCRIITWTAARPPKREHSVTTISCSGLTHVLQLLYCAIKDHQWWPLKGPLSAFTKSRIVIAVMAVFAPLLARSLDCRFSRRLLPAALPPVLSGTGADQTRSGFRKMPAPTLTAFGLFSY